MISYNKSHTLCLALKGQTQKKRTISCYSSFIQKKNKKIENS